MDLLGGALPNVMFIVGMLAIGLGLGIELKVVPLNKEIDKTGRFGAMIVGAILVASSLYIYLNPSLSSRDQAATAATSAALAPASTAAANTMLAVAGAPTVTSSAPTAAGQPAATSAPTAAPPTEAPQVSIPDLHGMSEKEAQDALARSGLQARKADTCNGPDQGDPKAKKHRVLCQNPAPNAAVPSGTLVEYVLQ